MFLPANLRELVESAAAPHPLLSSTDPDGCFGLCPREVAHLADFGKAIVIDVRGPEGFERRHIAGAELRAGARLDPREIASSSARRIVLCCDTGALSRRLALDLRRAGHRHVTYLVGGLDAWAGEGLSLS